MRAILVGSILAIAATFVVLTLLIVGNKAWRDGRDRWRRRRHRVLEPLVREYAAGRHDSLDDALAGYMLQGDRPVLEEALLEHARDPKGRSNERVARAIDERGWVDVYLRGLASRSWWRRAETAEKLGRSGASRAIPALVEAMEDPVSEVRLRAAQALGELGTGSALRPLVDALCEPSRWSAIRIAEILTKRGEDVVDELAGAFDGLNPTGKLAALDILARLRARRAVGWLEGRLIDPEPDVRARAAHALGAIGDPAPGPALVRALGDDAWPARAMAARALGRIRHEPAIERLCEALRDPEWWVRSNAAEALRALGSAGLDALRGMLDDEDTYARHQAILMLEEAGVLDEEVGHLVDTDETRRAPARALVHALIAAGQVDRLRDLRDNHADSRVRTALGGLVGALGPAEDDPAEATS